MAFIFSNSFQKLWCRSIDFMNLACIDFVPFFDLKKFIFCFKMYFKWLSLLKYEFISLLQTIKLVLNKCFLHKMTLFTSSIILSEIATLVDIYHLWSQKSTIDPCYSQQSFTFTMFRLKISKSWREKKTYKVFMVGGSVFYEAPSRN